MENNMNRRPMNVNSNGNYGGNSPRYMQNNARNSNNNGNNNNNNQGSGNASCEELMRAIMEADFFAQDLKLYLDTHPDDNRAVEMFREAVRQSKACKAAFEDSFWPLTAHSAGTNGTWDWLDGDWPPCN